MSVVWMKDIVSYIKCPLICKFERSRTIESSDQVVCIPDLNSLVRYIYFYLFRYAFILKGRGINPTLGRLHHRLNLLWSRLKSEPDIYTPSGLEMVQISDGVNKLKGITEGLTPVAIDYITMYEKDGIIFKDKVDVIAIDEEKKELVSYLLAEFIDIREFSNYCRGWVNYQVLRTDFMNHRLTPVFKFYSTRSHRPSAFIPSTDKSPMDQVVQIFKSINAHNFYPRSSVTTCRNCIYKNDCLWVAK